jgi:uncharacterized protein (DUF433 family)
MGLADTNIQNTPLYPVINAARYLRIPLGTMQSWLRGRNYTTKNGQQFSQPLIQRPREDFSQLSFTNLVEAHVLRVIRQDHNIRLDKVRAALDYISTEFNTHHPLAQLQFQTDGVDLFVDRMEHLVNVSRAGQLAMKDVLKHLLTRIEWDEHGLATRLFPIIHSPKGEEIGNLLYIDPRISFGRPTIAGTGIPTDVIADLYNAGDEIEAIADDYSCTQSQVYAAICFETAYSAA